MIIVRCRHYSVLPGVLAFPQITPRQEYQHWHPGRIRYGGDRGGVAPLPTSASKACHQSPAVREPAMGEGSSWEDS
jgi:hypothetical protein